MQKKKTPFQRLTNVIVWIMILVTVGTLVFTAISALGLLGPQ